MQIKNRQACPNGTRQNESFGLGVRRGMAFVWVILAMSMVLGAITIGVIIMNNTATILETQLEYYGQSTSMAKAGLFDSIAWFRRQTSQPVMDFKPLRDLEANPPQNDTDDPSIGIIREMTIDPSARLRGRYEVRNADVINITAQRGFDIINGSAWAIESTGYVYLQEDPDVPFNWNETLMLPNRILSSTKFGTEIRRAYLKLPGAAAICSSAAQRITIGKDCRVIGGSQNPAIATTPGKLDPNISLGAVVTGNPTAVVKADPYWDTPETMFGLTEAEIRAMADYVISDASQLPNPLVGTKIIFLEGNGTVVFDEDHPLSGKGLIYCKTSLTISDSVFYGLIYSVGHLRLHSASTIYGAVVSIDQVNLETTGQSKTTSVIYDQRILDDLLSSLGSYRFYKGFYQVE